MKNQHSYFQRYYLMLICAAFLLILPVNASKIQYTVNDGLSSNKITCLYQDNSLQYLWIGTKDGLNRFDGFNFETYYIERNNVRGSNNIYDIVEDNNNRIWVGTDRGLACFDYQFKKWIQLSSTLEFGKYQKLCLYSDTLLIAICNDTIIKVINTNKINAPELQQIGQKGYLYSIIALNDQLIVSGWMGIFQYQLNTNELTVIKQTLLPKLQNTRLFGSDNGIWAKNRDGLYYIPVIENKILFDKAEEYLSLNGIEINNYFVTDITPSGGNYLICQNNRIFRINITDKKIEPITNTRTSIDLNYNCVLSDYTGNIWGGTWKTGLTKISNQPTGFKTCKRNITNSPSFEVSSISKLNNQFLAIGIRQTGIAGFNIKKHILPPRYIQNKFILKDIVQNDYNVICIARDWKGRVWCGYHHDGFNVISGEDRAEINATIHEMTKNMFYNSCTSISVDSINKQIYFACGSTFYVFDDEKLTFQSQNIREASSILSDDNGYRWVGTLNGLAFYSPDFKKRTIPDSLQYPASLNDANINCLYKDLNGNIWIGTYGEGLFKYDKSKNTIQQVIYPKHIDAHVILSIIEDPENEHLWLGTNKGLLCYKKAVGIFRKFTIEDGIHDNDFNLNAVYRDTDGTLYFGGNNGFTYFQPKNVINFAKLPAPVISGIKINGEFAPISHVVNKKGQIKLPYENNNFEFTFFSRDFSTPETYTYGYILLGYSNNEILCTPATNKASFTNVMPGKYQFQVRVTRPNTEWSEITLSPEIVVLRPWYRSIIALILYSIITVFLGILTLHLIKKDIEYKNSISIARIEKENTEKTSAAKLRFFTDIAHEIRTPLTLILGPLEELMNKRKFDSLTHSTLTTVQKSAYKLSGLMEELLLFRKAENGSLPLNAYENNLVALIDSVCQLYSRDIINKNIRLNKPAADTEYNKVFDLKKIEKVISNLISNAIKFTEQNGEINIGIIGDANNPGFGFWVSDSGKGMDKEEQKKLYNRFYSTAEDNQQGIGIGLALSKRIIELHSGTITVHSEPSKGSKFIVTIPALEPTTDNNMQETTIFKPSTTSDNGNVDVQLEAINGKILVVEDDDEIREYINKILSSHFTVLVSKNGKEGFEMAKENIPDLIISDYQMPIMDGIKMCQKLKNEILTSHIPIILLSAYAEVENQISALEMGAHDYIAKPFYHEILLRKVNNILLSRKSLIKNFQSEKKINVSQFDSSDRRFINQINKVIINEIDNPLLDINFICKQLGVSRTSVYTKLKSMLDVSPGEYIRKTKFKEAYRLITEKGYNVNEAAVAIGMSSSYFNTSFKKEFGISPGKV